MSGPAFTPGPWRIHVERAYSQLATSSVYICTEDEWPASQLARVNIMDGLNEREANARLIAAAPEMLEALYQYESDLLRPPTGDSLERRLARVRKVIAKARPAP